MGLQIAVLFHLQAWWDAAKMAARNMSDPNMTPHRCWKRWLDTIIPALPIYGH